MKSIKLVGIVDVFFLGVVIAVTLLAFREGMRITVVGILCAALTFGMYAAPLSVMVIIIFHYFLLFIYLDLYLHELSYFSFHTSNN